MYEFITHTWNTVKGECPHDCGYCYMKRWGKLKPTRFDEKELKTDLGKNNFIFVGSSCDLFGVGNIEWVDRTLQHCRKFDNNYFFQSKNPFAFTNAGFVFPEKSTFCTTIETNRFYEQMGDTPKPYTKKEIGSLILNMQSDIPEHLKEKFLNKFCQINSYKLLKEVRRYTDLDVLKVTNDIFIIRYN